MRPARRSSGCQACGAPTDVKRRGLAVRASFTPPTAITLYGNVGGDPETRTIPGKHVTKQFYHLMALMAPIIDDMVEREFTTPEREVRTFSIAVSKKDDEGKDVHRMQWPLDPPRRLEPPLPPGRIIGRPATG